MIGIGFCSREIVLAVQITDGIREATSVALIIVLCGPGVEYSFYVPNWFVWWFIMKP